eukprot:m.51741 g.51741  ORF g.51741 m.51741 type:complete len:700 (-) comp11258_c0_seq2:2871-4970(-)
MAHLSVATLTTTSGNFNVVGASVVAKQTSRLETTLETRSKSKPGRLASESLPTTHYAVTASGVGVSIYEASTCVSSINVSTSTSFQHHAVHDSSSNCYIAATNHEQNIVCWSSTTPSMAEAATVKLSGRVVSILVGAPLPSSCCIAISQTGLVAMYRIELSDSVKPKLKHLGTANTGKFVAKGTKVLQAAVVDDTTLAMACKTRHGTTQLLTTTFEVTETDGFNVLDGQTVPLQYGLHPKSAMQSLVFNQKSNSCLCLWMTGHVTEHPLDTATPTLIASVDPSLHNVSTCQLGFLADATIVAVVGHERGGNEIVMTCIDKQFGSTQAEVRLGFAESTRDVVTGVTLMSDAQQTTEATTLCVALVTTVRQALRATFGLSASTSLADTISSASVNATATPVVVASFNMESDECVVETIDGSKDSKLEELAQTFSDIPTLVTSKRQSAFTKAMKKLSDLPILPAFLAVQALDAALKAIEPTPVADIATILKGATDLSGSTLPNVLRSVMELGLDDPLPLVHLIVSNVPDLNEEDAIGALKLAVDLELDITTLLFFLASNSFQEMSLISSMRQQLTSKHVTAIAPAMATFLTTLTNSSQSELKETFGTCVPSLGAAFLFANAFIDAHLVMFLVDKKARAAITPLATIVKKLEQTNSLARPLLGMLAHMEKSITKPSKKTPQSKLEPSAVHHVAAGYSIEKIAI